MFEIYKKTAKKCTTWEQANFIIKQAENNETITDKQYYTIKHIAFDSVIANNQ